MSPEHVVRCREWLDEQLAQLGNLRNASPRDPSFKLWRQNTLTVLQRIWPNEPARSERFRRIPFSPTSPRADGRTQRECFAKACAETSEYLRALAEEVELVGVPSPGQASGTAAAFTGDDQADEIPVLDLANPGDGARNGPGPADATELDLAHGVASEATRPPQGESTGEAPPRLAVRVNAPGIARAPDEGVGPPRLPEQSRRATPPPAPAEEDAPAVTAPTLLPTVPDTPADASPAIILQSSQTIAPRDVPDPAGEAPARLAPPVSAPAPAPAPEPEPPITEAPPRLVTPVPAPVTPRPAPEPDEHAPPRLATPEPAPRTLPAVTAPSASAPHMPPAPVVPAPVAAVPPALEPAPAPKPARTAPVSRRPAEPQKPARDVPPRAQRGRKGAGKVRLKHMLGLQDLERAAQSRPEPAPVVEVAPAAPAPVAPAAPAPVAPAPVAPAPVAPPPPVAEVAHVAPPEPTPVAPAVPAPVAEVAHVAPSPVAPPPPAPVAEAAPVAPAAVAPPPRAPVAEVAHVAPAPVAPQPPAPVAEVAPVAPEPVAEVAPAAPAPAPPAAPEVPTPEPSEFLLNDEEASHAAREFLRNSLVLGLQGRPVTRVGDGTPFLDPDAVAIATLATDVARYGVPEHRRTRVRAGLLALAQALEAGHVDWTMLRDVVLDAMEHPDLARRVLPIVLPWLDRAA